MSNIITSVPISNSNFSPDISMGKVMPLFAAAHLNEDSHEYAHTDLWNNVNARAEVGYSREAYAELCEKRLSEKYHTETLQILGQIAGEPVIRTDTDPDFKVWALSKVETALEHGDLEIKPVASFVCNECEASLAVAAGPTPSCSCCSNSEISVATRDALLLTMKPESVGAAEQILPDGIAINALLGYRTANKRRRSGIELDRFGIKDDVLDPRIAQLLLGAYAASQVSADGITMIGAASSISHNVISFTASMASQLEDLPTITLRGIPKAPADYFSYLVSEGIISRQTLCRRIVHKIMPRLVHMKNDMSPQTAEILLFSRKNSRRPTIQTQGRNKL